MRSGFVLIELIAGLVLAALIAAIAAPQIVAISNAAAVRDEASRIITALDATRGAALRLGAVATLTVADTSYHITAIVGSDTVTVSQQPGPAFRGVMLSGGGQPIAFGPDGLAMGVANRTLVMTKGSASRKVVMSKYGRLSY